MDMIFF